MAGRGVRGHREPKGNGLSLSPKEAARAVGCVLEELARRRMSRLALASDAKISLSTLEKVLSGRRTLTLATVVRIEDALGLRLRDEPRGDPIPQSPTSRPIDGTAPDELGSYNRAAVAWLEGSYLRLRPSFGEPGAVYAYRTDIAWDADANILRFRKAERVDRDFTQFGAVAVPHQSGHIYLVTNRHGQHRLIVVSRPAITGEMHGLLTTLRAGRGSHLSPVATPLAMRPVGNGETIHDGRIGRGHPAFSEYAAILRRTLAGHYAELVAM